MHRKLKKLFVPWVNDLPVGEYHDQELLRATIAFSDNGERTLATSAERHMASPCGDCDEERGKDYG